MIMPLKRVGKKARLFSCTSFNFFRVRFFCTKFVFPQKSLWGLFGTTSFVVIYLHLAVNYKVLLIHVTNYDQILTIF